MTTENPVCLDCAQGFHADCEQLDSDGKCCCGEGDDVGAGAGSSGSGSESKQLSTGLRDGLKWAKPDAEIRDISSTGRKRAARNFPIDPNADCEWRGLLFAGGGRVPIIGCTKGTMKHRHHGPLMLTTINIEGNVHRICDPCHRVWHVCNDAYVAEFVQTVMWLPHDPFTSAPVELLTLADTSEKIRIDLSFDRIAKRTYSKERHAYKPLLDSLQASGEIVNPWLGI